MPHLLTKLTNPSRHILDLRLGRFTIGRLVLVTLFKYSIGITNCLYRKFFPYLRASAI